jgi:septal ring factor EnvC (AmiA/AmiB activator)
LKQSRDDALQQALKASLRVDMLEPVHESDGEEKCDCEAGRLCTNCSKSSDFSEKYVSPGKYRFDQELEEIKRLLQEARSENLILKEQLEKERAENRKLKEQLSEADAKVVELSAPFSV